MKCSFNSFLLTVLNRDFKVLQGLSLDNGHGKGKQQKGCFYVLQFTFTYYMNDTKMLRAVLNKFLKKYPTKQNLYSHLPPISQNIQVR